jgi:hypothetical protein
MTPLVAGIALTGKAPVYENVYMSGLKQKAAGEAAKAKQLTEAEKEYQKAISVGSDKVIPSLRQRHEKKGVGFLASSAEILSKNPVNGLNEVNRLFFSTKEGLNNLIEQSEEVKKRTTPGYSDKFLVPTKLMAALNSNRDLEEAYNDPATGLQEEEAIYNYKLDFNPETGAVAISFNDIPKQDVVRDYFNWQKNTVYNSDPELGKLFAVGEAKRREIERVVTPEASENLLTTLSGNRVVAANWRNLGYDITTKGGRDKVYQDYLAPRVDAFTAGGGFNINIGGGGSLATSAEVTTPEVTTSAEFSWKPVVRDDGKYEVEFIGEGKPTSTRIVALGSDNKTRYVFDTKAQAEEFIAKEGRKTFTGTSLPITASSVTLAIPKDEAFAVGEPGAKTTFGEKVTSSSIAVRPSRLESINIYKGDTPKTFGLFRIRKGDVIPDEYLNKFKPEDKMERVYIVAESAPAVNFTGKESVTGATIYIPATKTNLNLIKEAIPNKDAQLIKRVEDIRDGKQKLGKGNVIGAATKGAERQPKSGFSLLEFDNLA